MQLKGVLAGTLDYFHVPDKEKNEVLGAFAEHKNELLTGYHEVDDKGLWISS